ncbi:MAG: RagB/SusD family nutrient uptake outer membrane protein [Butyricimonas faecihominis]
MDVIAQQYSIDQNGGDYYRIKNFEYDKAETIINNIWSQAYTTIANLNNILENIENKENILHPTYYNIIKGEALGLRAFLHFELLRMFGWGE